MKQHHSIQIWEAGSTRVHGTIRRNPETIHTLSGAAEEIERTVTVAGASRRMSGCEWLIFEYLAYRFDSICGKQEALEFMKTPVKSPERSTPSRKASGFQRRSSRLTEGCCVGDESFD
jgi:hypothetical protein